MKRRENSLNGLNKAKKRLGAEGANGTDDAEDEKFMRLAIAEARAGIRCGGGPFGCVITRGGKVIARAHNSVVRDDDATAHAEVKAIRLSGRKFKSPFLEGCVVYSTCEPCPMCFAACHWARVARIVYGTRIADAAAAGFNELRVSNSVMKKLGSDKIVLTPDALRNECRKLFKEWKHAGGEKY